MSVFRDKVVWITGAGSGIGRAVAREFAGEGACIALLGRRPDVLEGVYDEVCTHGGCGQAQALDVTDRDQVARVTGRLLDDYGRVDILVNSAGINVPRRGLFELAPEDWDRIVATNLTGAWNMIHAALPAMKAQRDGLVVNVSSVAGRRVSSLSGAAYTASKHGLTGLSVGISEEAWPEGVRATALHPGEVNTPMMEQRPQEVPPQERARMIQPEDVARTVRFLALLPPHVTVPELLLMPTHRRAAP